MNQIQQKLFLSQYNQKTGETHLFPNPALNFNFINKCVTKSLKILKIDLESKVIYQQQQKKIDLIRNKYHYFKLIFIRFTEEGVVYETFKLKISIHNPSLYAFSFNCVLEKFDNLLKVVSFKTKGVWDSINRYLFLDTNFNQQNKEYFETIVNAFYKKPKILHNKDFDSYYN